MDAAGWTAARDRLLAGIPEPFSGWLASRADQLLRLPLSTWIPSAARLVSTRVWTPSARAWPTWPRRVARAGARQRCWSATCGPPTPSSARLAPRLRPVRALTLRARTAAYVRALDGLPGRRARPGGRVVAGRRPCSRARRPRAGPPCSSPRRSTSPPLPVPSHSAVPRRR